MPQMAVQTMQQGVAGAADAGTKVQDAERHTTQVAMRWHRATAPTALLQGFEARAASPQLPLGMHGWPNMATLVGPAHVVLPWLQGRLPLPDSGQQVGAPRPGPPPSGAGPGSQRRSSQQRRIRHAGRSVSRRQAVRTPHAGASRALAQTAVTAKRQRSGAARCPPCRGGCQAQRRRWNFGPQRERPPTGHPWRPPSDGNAEGPFLPLLGC